MPTREQIEAVVSRMGGTEKARARLLEMALAGDNNTLVALRFWAKRHGLGWAR